MHVVKKYLDLGIYPTKESAMVYAVQTQNCRCFMEKLIYSDEYKIIIGMDNRVVVWEKQGEG